MSSEVPGSKSVPWSELGVRDALLCLPAGSAHARRSSPRADVRDEAASPGSARACLPRAAAHGLKYTHIVLDRGVTLDQPMLTLRARGALAGVAAVARDRAERLAGDGFTVVRVKVEASPFNAGVPQHDADATPDRYFEHHVKLVADQAGIDVARRISVRHTAHVSRNARRGDPDGRHERFVTQRCHGCGRPEARRRLDALLADLTAAGLGIVEIEEEYVALDSNPAVDTGWISA
ncbi:MAG TPA: hypothetical protein VFW27_30410 [Actinoplanes sp.]|nr:hypothetical protein [Actinoplanes sp.]